MAMAKFTVDGPNRLLIAKPGVTDVDVKVDLYSDAKEHWIDSADMKYPFPFRTVGGDPIGGGRFAGDLYFLTNGWKIRPQEADHDLTFDGNLYLDDGQTGSLVVPTLGDFTVLVSIERSADVRAIETSSGGGPVTANVDIVSTLMQAVYDSVAGTLTLVAALLDAQKALMTPSDVTLTIKDELGQTLYTLVSSAASGIHRKVVPYFNLPSSRIYLIHADWTVGTDTYQTVDPLTVLGAKVA